MKNLLSIICFLILSTSIYAQNNEVKDSKAKAVLDKLSAKYKASKKVILFGVGVSDEPL